MKKSKTFRLSSQAQENLTDIARVSGANETAIIEMALAFLVTKLIPNAAAKFEPVESDFVSYDELKAGFESQ